MEMKLIVMHKLLQKGFSYTKYETDGEFFYSKEYKDEVLIKYLAEKENIVDSSFDMSGITLFIEISEDLKYSQWIFLGGLDEFYVFQEMNEFNKFLDFLPNEINYN